MMKIIHYIPSLDRASGGTTAYMQLLGKPLGQLVDLHIVSHASANEVEIPNCTIHRISSSVLGGMKAEWTQLLDTIQPDVVHVNCCWLPQMAFVQKWAQQKGYKVVLTPHGMLEPWIMKRHYFTRKLPALLLYQQKAIQNVDMIHATAESEKNNLLKLGYNSNITIVPNGIDFEEVPVIKETYGSKKIVFLSRVHVKKGIELLLEAWKQLPDNDWTLEIAGEGDVSYIQQLQAKIDDEQIHHVTFVGGQYGQAKWNFIKSADIFVLPTYCENFGIAVAEALAVGVPVITTKGAPWKELVQLNCGWWIDISIEELLKTLNTAINTPIEELQSMGLRGSNLIKEKYDIVSITKAMHQLYLDLK